MVMIILFFSGLLMAQDCQMSFLEKAYYYLEKVPQIFYYRPRNYKMHLVMKKIDGVNQKKTLKYVNLKDVYPTHTVDFPKAVEKLNKRIALIRKSPFRKRKKLTKKSLQKLLVSKSPIVLIEDKKLRRYYTLEGVGRIIALKKGLKKDKKIQVDVVSDRGEEIMGELREVRKLFYE